MLAVQILAMSFGVLMNAPNCDPTHPAPRYVGKNGPSVSKGGPSNGTLENATRIPEEGPYLKILTGRHRARRLNFASDALAKLLLRAAETVGKKHPGAVLWVGNIARPQGGSLSPYSVSHQTGLDADLAFYLYDTKGKIFAPEDLLPLDSKGESFDGKLRLAVDLQWDLIVALMSDPEIEVEYLFIHRTLKEILMSHARAIGTDPAFLKKVDDILFQPSGGPHRDHLHIRIACPTADQGKGCR